MCGVCWFEMKITRLAPKMWTYVLFQASAEAYKTMLGRASLLAGNLAPGQSQGKAAANGAPGAPPDLQSMGTPLPLHVKLSQGEPEILHQVRNRVAGRMEVGNSGLSRRFPICSEHNNSSAGCIGRSQNSHFQQFFRPRSSLTNVIRDDCVLVV